VLIPGLKVKVDGMSDDKGRFVAGEITVDGDDLETAEMIQSGLHPTAEQVAANVQTLAAHNEQLATHQQNIAANQQNIGTNQQNIAANKQQIEANMKDIDENTQRFTALAEYDVKGQATVNFATGSSKISAADQEELKKLAGTATNLNGYIIEVTDYADATGSAENRAKAVVIYLVQQVACRSGSSWRLARWANMERRHRTRLKPGGLRTAALRSRFWSTRASPVPRGHSPGSGGMGCCCARKQHVPSA
jgi:outer membrane protein OmpA-like peptidoglycan-associated protein